MKLMRRVFAIVTIFALLLANGSLSVLAEDVLNLPGALRVIDEEAFYGDTSIDKVVLPDNVKEIRARAFADSSLSEINLPDSLEVIDDTAFDGPEKVAVTANEGSYAYSWAVENGYIIDGIPVTSITLNKSRLNLTVGTTATLSTTVLPTDATDKSILWTSSDRSVANVNENGAIIATGAGTAIITASAADGSGVSQTCTVNSTAKNEVLSIQSITRNSQTVNLGDTVTWTVELSGAVGLVEYTYILKKDGTEIDRISETPFNTYQAVIEQPGTYTLVVQCTDSKDAAESSSDDLTVSNDALRINSISLLTENPVVGDFLDWLIDADGGYAPYTYGYKFYKIGKSGGKILWNNVESKDNMFTCGDDLFEQEHVANYYLQVTVTDSQGESVTRTSETILLAESPVYIINGSDSARTKTSFTYLNDLEDSASVTVNSDGQWSADTSESWIHIDNTSGDNGDTLAMSVEQNNGSARSGEVVVHVGDKSAHITLSQCAALTNPLQIMSPTYSEDELNPTFIAEDTDSIDVVWQQERQSGGFIVSIEEWDRSDGGGFTNVAKSELNSSKYHYTFTGLTLQKGRLYRIHLIRKPNDERNGLAAYSYFVPYNGTPTVKISGSTSVTSSMEGTGDYKRFVVSSSGTWTACSNNNWLMVYSSSLNQTKLQNNGKSAEDYSIWHDENSRGFYVSALPNTSTQARTGTVTVYCGSATATITVNQEGYYIPAMITSPSLATNGADRVNIQPGAMIVAWSNPTNGTGKYNLRLFEKDPDQGYLTVLYEKNLTNRQYTISSDLLHEGEDYRLVLYTEITSGTYGSQTYFFHVSHANELAVNAIVSGTGKVGDSVGIRVDAQASGGSGGYKYCFYLMSGNEVISRSIGWNTQSYWTFPLPEVGDYYIQVYVMDTEGTVISYDSSTINAIENTDEYVLIDSETAVTRGIDGNGGSVVVNVNCPRDWQFSKDVSWLTIDASGYKQSRLTASATANTGMSVRTGHVTITCGNTQAVLTINQGGAGSVALSASTLECESVGGEQQITVESSGTWTAVPRDTWITVTPATGNTGSFLKITAAQNNANALRIGCVDVTSDGVTKTVTVHQQGTSNAAITSVRNIQQVETGVETNIMVYVSNTDRVRMNIDGKYTTQEYFDNEGFHVCIVRYKFYSSGTHKLTFSYYSNGQWKDDSTVYSLNVVAPNGNLDSPAVSVDKVLHDKGDEVNLSWTDAGNATAYTAYIYKDGELLSKKAEQTTKQIKLTAADTTLAGHYMVVIMSTAQGYNQGSGYAEFDVQWEGYLQIKNATAFKYKNMTEEQPQLRFGNKYKITEECYIGDILVGKVQSGDVILGYADMAYFGTEFWHPCLKNGIYEHTWFSSYEAEHPHKVFNKCAECDAISYTDTISSIASVDKNTCCLCGNHNYELLYYQISHPHYAVLTCVRCRASIVDKSKSISNYSGCSECDNSGNTPTIISEFDKVFWKAGYQENGTLRRYSADLSFSTYSGSRTLKQEIAEFGFDENDIEVYNFDNTPHTSGYSKGHYIAFAFAWKDIVLEDGETTQLFVIVGRGTTDNAEWQSNFNIGTGSTHLGFNIAASDVYESFRAYITKHKKPQTSTYKVWVTGHSRAAAVANLLGAIYLPSMGIIEADIYDYTYACPYLTLNSTSGSGWGIQNYIVQGDVVPLVPLSNWGYQRYGQVHSIDNPRSKNGHSFNLPNETYTVSAQIYSYAKTPEEYRSKLYPEIKQCLISEGSLVDIGDVFIKLLPTFFVGWIHTAEWAGRVLDTHVVAYTDYYL